MTPPTKRWLVHSILISIISPKHQTVLGSPTMPMKRLNNAHFWGAICWMQQNRRNSTNFTKANKRHDTQCIPAIICTLPIFQIQNGSLRLKHDLSFAMRTCCTCIAWGTALARAHNMRLHCFCGYRMVKQFNSWLLRDQNMQKSGI